MSFPDLKVSLIDKFNRRAFSVLLPNYQRAEAHRFERSDQSLS